MVIGGGLHHAFPDHGEGFCLLNDVAIAVRAWRAAGVAERIAVLDLDVHQGNGTAAILGGEAESFTVSLHQEANYPMPKPPSHLDVGLPDGIDDLGYLAALEEPLQKVLAFRPDLLLYLAGADPYEHDLLGGLGLTLAGLAERDRRVCAAARDAGRSPGRDPGRRLRRAPGRHGAHPCQHHPHRRLRLRLRPGGPA